MGAKDGYRAIGGRPTRLAAEGEVMVAGSSPLVSIAIFVVAAVAVWLASTRLSISVEILGDRWHLGQALAGLLLLAVVEDLPEVVVVVSGALVGHLDLITGNLLGGIATQTVILVAVDAIAVPDRPLSNRVSSLLIVLEGLQGMVVFSLVILATQLPASLMALRLTPGTVLIVVAWVLTIVLIQQARAGLPWRAAEQTTESLDGDGVSERRDERAAEKSRTATGRALLTFVASALVITVAGYALEESGNAIAGDVGLSGIVFGGTVLALATGLPEFSAGYAAARGGDFALAVSGVFGSNTFLPVLFLPAALLSGRAVLPQAGAANVYLTGLGMLLTAIYVWGFLFRPNRQYLRLGPDSIAVLLVYAAGIAGLVAVARGG